MINTRKIQRILVMYQETKNHETVKRAFGLNNAQEYAINIFGRDNALSPETLAEHIGKVKDGMTIGEVAIALGFTPEAALTRKE